MNLIMFDYDGVIVDSLEICYFCFLEACRETASFDLGSKEDFVALFEGNIYESLSEHGLDSDSVDRILKNYEVKQNSLLKTLHIFKGIEPALNRIARNNRIIIITSNLSDATGKILKDNGINCVEDIIGAEKEKSKIKKIHKAVSAWPDIPAYYVGDTKGDMTEGKKAGVKTVGVLWGWHNKEKLRDGGADYFVGSPEEMADFFTGDSV